MPQFDCLLARMAFFKLMASSVGVVESPGTIQSCRQGDLPECLGVERVCRVNWEDTCNYMHWRGNSLALECPGVLCVSPSDSFLYNI